MQVYINNIWVAVITFPLVAALITLPYALFQYRRYGAIPAFRTFVVFAFTFYLLCAYYLVILPLPADTNAVVPYAATPQLQPFHFIGVYAASHNFHWGSLTSLIQLVKSPIIYGVFFNVLITVPFGAFLRYYFKLSWWKCTVCGLALSLFFELTQLSGLYGIYAHPYRLFDVDDLIQNTVGAWLGSVLVLPFLRLAPDIDTINEIAWERGQRVSLLRRGFAFVVDYLIAGLITLILGFVVNIAVTSAGFPRLDGNGPVVSVLNFLALLLFFCVVPWLTGGQTIGHKILRLQIISEPLLSLKRRGSAPRLHSGNTQYLPTAIEHDEGLRRPKVRQYLVRYVSLFLFVLVPGWLVNWLSGLDFNTLSIHNATLFNFLQDSQAAIVLMYFLGVAVWLVSLLVRAVKARHREQPMVMINEHLSKTYLAAL
jgi:glycopeptide antibiotics resistance protein